VNRINPIIENIEDLNADHVRDATHKELVEALDDQKDGHLVKRRLAAMFSLRQDPTLTRKIFRALDAHNLHETATPEAQKELARRRREVELRREELLCTG